jgi:cytochrome c-type biogenesis protein CcmH/NrfG
MADLARLDELRRLFAEHPRRYFAPLASALRRAGDPGAAVQVARAQLAEQPEHLTGHVILAQALADVGDLEGARAAFERAHAVDDGNVVALGALVQLARGARRRGR